MTRSKKTLLGEVQHRALDGEDDHEHREHDGNGEPEDEGVLHVPARSAHALLLAAQALSAEMGGLT
jgi:hypothetical protein